VAGLSAVAVVVGWLVDCPEQPASTPASSSFKTTLGVAGAGPKGSPGAPTPGFRVAPTPATHRLIDFETLPCNAAARETVKLNIERLLYPVKPP